MPTRCSSSSARAAWAPWAEELLADLDPTLRQATRNFLRHELQEEALSRLWGGIVPS